MLCQNVLFLSNDNKNERGKKKGENEEGCEMQLKGILKVKKIII